MGYRRETIARLYQEARAALQATREAAARMALASWGDDRDGAERAAGEALTALHEAMRIRRRIATVRASMGRARGAA